MTLELYDLTHFYPVTSTTLAFVGTEPRRLIRWGTDGIAFLTTDSVVVVRGAAVIPPSTTATPSPPSRPCRRRA